MSAAHERLFARGDHYAVSTHTTTVLLPGSQRELAADLWCRADAGASFEELLDVVLAAGLTEVTSFALVEQSDDGLRVLVRGDFVAVVDSAEGERQVTAPAGHVWAEALLEQAGTITVRSAGSVSDDDARLPLPAGIVSAAAVVLAADRIAEPAAPEPAVPEPEQPVPDQGGPTFVSQMPDFDRPQVPGEEQAPVVVSRPVAVLVFSTGEVIEVDRTVLVGRAPEVRRFASDDQPVLVTVPSPQQEISSTHLEIRPGAGVDHGMAVATDMGSTNGTMIVQPGLSPDELQPGIAMSLVPGAVLDLGDGVTIQVTNP